ncbi:MAG TPA: hypothetical protein VHF26_19255 [Trebonia sp.]|nr:hypothetical protein [Trebonia sp.]
MSDFVSVTPGRLDQLTQRLEALSAGLAANAAKITAMMNDYAQQGGDVAGLAQMLAQAQARAAPDAANMRARTELAYKAAPAGGSFHASATVSIPWDVGTVSVLAARADAQELSIAMSTKDPAERMADIKRVESDIKDHLAAGTAGLAYLSAFYNDAGPQVAALADTLYAANGTLARPLTAADQQILNTFGTGLAYVIKNGTGATALGAQATAALAKAPDMWSVAMLFKYGPSGKAYGTGSAATALRQAVSNATVQISPHVDISADSPAVKTLQAAWQWAQVHAPQTPELYQWMVICGVSPYMGAIPAPLRDQVAQSGRAGANNAFGSGTKLLITGAVSAGIIIVPNWLTSSGEITAFVHAAQIYQSPDFEQLRRAYLSGQPAEITVDGTPVLYEPGLPAVQGYKGMTLFGERGFVLGPGAFRSEAELAKTILHECYRLNNSGSFDGVSSGEVARSETDDAFNFAENSYSALVDEPGVPGDPLGGAPGDDGGGGEGGGGAGGE